MFRFIKIFIITYIVLFVPIIVMTNGNITGPMIGATGQVSMVNTVIWCIVKPIFTKYRRNTK